MMDMLAALVFLVGCGTIMVGILRAIDTWLQRRTRRRHRRTKDE